MIEFGEVDLHAATATHGPNPNCPAEFGRGQGIRCSFAVIDRRRAAVGNIAHPKGRDLEGAGPEGQLSNRLHICTMTASDPP